MKTSLSQIAAILICAGYSVSPAQTTSGPLFGKMKGREAPNLSISPELYRLQIVERIFDAGSPVTVGSTQLHRMGDEAAASLLRIIGNRPSQLTQAQKMTILEMIQKAYELPQAISLDVNKHVGATSFLLQYLEASNDDNSVKEAIASTRQKLEGVAQHLR
jgi:hypothetical protein